LLLDEPASAQDSFNELRMIECFRSRARAGAAVLFVTHRVENAKWADRIIVLADGHAIEDGRHHDLVARRGRYSALLAARQH